MVQKVVGSIPISHPIISVAGIVQRLVCKFSKLEMRFRLSLPAPFLLIYVITIDILSKVCYTESSSSLTGVP